MTTRKSIRVTRPYDSEEDFIAAEGWTAGKRGMVIIGQAELAPGTTVRVDVNLRSGAALARAEGTVEEYVAAEGDRPGGVRIRFTRMSPDTQQFLKRVAGSGSGKSGRVPAADAEGSSLEPSTPEGSAPEAASGPGESSVEAAPLNPTSDPQNAIFAQPGLHRTTGALANTAARERLASLNQRAVRAVAPPNSRDDLLARLRVRSTGGRASLG